MLVNLGANNDVTVTGSVAVTDNAGSLTVDDGGTTLSVDDGAGSLTVDNGGTFAVQDTQVLTDNGAFTDGTSKLFVGGYIYDEVAGTALTENDAAAARVNANRAQIGVIEDGSTRARYATVTAANALKVDASGVAVPITDNAGSITVDYATTGSGTATGALRVELPTNGTGVIATVSNVATIGTSVTPGTSAAHLGKAEDAVAASGDTGVMSLGVRTDTPATTVSGSGDYHPLLIDANGALWTHPIQSSFRIEVASAGLTTATTAYTAGDTAGTEMTFANAARVSGWGGVITGATLIDKSLRSSAISIELWLFKAASTPAADNAAADWSDANMQNLVGIINFDSGSWKSVTSNCVNIQQNLGIGYGCSATSLFGSFVLRGVPSSNFYSATTDLYVTLHMLRD